MSSGYFILLRFQGSGIWSGLDAATHKSVIKAAVTHSSGGASGIVRAQQASFCLSPSIMVTEWPGRLAFCGMTCVQPENTALSTRTAPSSSQALSGRQFPTPEVAVYSLLSFIALLVCSFTNITLSYYCSFMVSLEGKVNLQTLFLSFNFVLARVGLLLLYLNFGISLFISTK